MSITDSILLQLEKIPELRERKVSHNVLFLVHNLGTEGFFVRLALENLFLDGSSLQYKFSTQIRP
jgi:hypothetical protein